MGWREGMVTVSLILLATGLTAAQNLWVYHAPWWTYIGPTTLAAPLMFVAQALVNGIMEELSLRAVTLPHLVALVRNPYVAFFLMATLFDALHLPRAIIGFHIDAPWWRWVLWAALPSVPNGLLFGFIYWRTRSIVPGILFHTYATLWTTIR